MGEWVDLARWKRRDHYRWFRRYDHPFFSVTAEVDVTDVWYGARDPGAPSFFLTTLFMMLNAVNSVEAFRLRLRPRGVWRHDRVGVGPTIRRDDETFGFARLEPAATLDAFVSSGEAAITRALAPSPLKPPKLTDDVVYQSTLPWLRFTAFTNALPGRDSVPRIIFGRAVRAGGRMVMPVAAEVHHALVDGFDVARFFEAFSTELARRSPGGRLPMRRRH